MHFSASQHVRGIKLEEKSLEISIIVNEKLDKPRFLTLIRILSISCFIGVDKVCLVSSQH